MIRTRVIFGVSLALLVSASTANAGWGSHGSNGSHGSSGGRVVVRSWGSLGSRGSSWGLLSRLHSHKWRRAHGSWGSSGGSRGSWGSSGGSRGSWGSSGGSRGSWGSHGGSRGSWGSSGGSHGSSGGVYYTPKKEEKKEEKKADPKKSDKKEKKVSTGDVLIKVAVPSAAKIWVNERLTTSTGDLRQFVSRDLQKGLDYTFRIRAELERNGEKLSSTRKVTVQAGETVGVNFDFRKVETKITLIVPNGAQVTLAGKTTTTSGKVRVFSTRKLTAGESWKDYKILVSLDKNGKKLIQERTIDLNGGENRTLTFKFDNDKVAVR